MLDFAAREEKKKSASLRSAHMSAHSPSHGKRDESLEEDFLPPLKATRLKLREFWDQLCGL